MKNNKKHSALLPILTSILFTVGAAGLMQFLFVLTKYLPFRLAALTLLLPVTVDSILLLLGHDASIKDKCRVKDSDSGEKPRKKFLCLIKSVFVNFSRGVAISFNKMRKTARILLFAASCIGIVTVFSLIFRRMTSVYSLAFWQLVILLALFVVFIILDKWCKHTNTESTFFGALLSNIRVSLAIGRTLIFFIAAAIAIKLLMSYDLQKYLVYITAFIFYYSAVFIAISFAVRTLKKELSENPLIVIPLPFVTVGTKELGVLSYLENNTGITMRSLWSIRLIKHIVPYTVMLVALILWLSTGIVQVEAHQHGAVYRFGQLRNEVLQPGIHLTLPTPFDTVVCCDTEVINKITIGYSTNAYSDNTWTADHGGQEYKLLLGGGNELVSINLHLEYRISNLHSYLRNCSSPESLLEAMAYELVTDRTIETDLSTLLSVDRDEFAKKFREELTESIEKYDIGLEVVSVVLESIHPPLDISEVYQQMISAEIDAERYILNAQAMAEVKIAEAKKQYDTAINAANAEKFSKIAAAQSSVAEFMASVEANNAYSDAYKFKKYLDALCEAYGKSRLVIIGDGIDPGNIYFTNMSPAN